MLLVAATVAQAQEPSVVGSRGGVDVWWVPQPDPGPGYSAGNIVLKTTDENARIVTFENLRIDGPLVQTWLSGAFGGPTAKGAPTAGPTYDASWIEYDSHLFIREDGPNMIGGGAGGAYGGISEDNDESIGAIGGLPPASGFDPVSGVGSIYMAAPTDAFFLDTDFQSNEVDLAYVVTETDPAAADGHIPLLTLGVLGEGIVNSGDPGGANWGFGDNPEALAIMAIPEPASGLLALCSILGLAAAFRRRS
jgi:hypothetical protein